MHYLKNKELIAELEKCKEIGPKYVSEKLGGMFYLIARNLIKKPNWSGYTWKDDMVQEAVLTCTKYIYNFDPNKSQNPFAYISQICNNSFKHYVDLQKRHSQIKNVCYMEIESLEEKNHTWIAKAIDYTVLVKTKNGKLPKSMEKDKSGEDIEDDKTC